MAFEQFHDYEELTVVLANVVNGADVGMVQGAGGAGLAAEAFHGLGIASQVFGEEFQGYVATELGIFGLVDYAHSSAAELMEDAIMRDGLAEH
jgi:hypothetical protein